MEFFREIKNTHLSIVDIQTDVTINALSQICASIDKVISCDGETGEIYCLWGLFDIQRQCLKQCIRFSLLNCPHALAWTITYKDDDRLILHCTIDDQVPEPEFVETIDEFLDDWVLGLHQMFFSER